MTDAAAGIKIQAANLSAASRILFQLEIIIFKLLSLFLYLFRWLCTIGRVLSLELN